MNPTDGPKIIVADTHEIVRGTISNHLEQHCGVTVVAQTKDGYQTLKAIRQQTPDVVLLDMSIAHPTGSETLARLRIALPELKIIVVTDDPAFSSAFVALSHGVVSILSRAASADDYVNAVRAAINDYAYLPADLVREFVKSRRTLMRSGNIFGLSSREIEVLEACIGGSSTKDVASSLDISVRTVETHRHNIYRKTDCNSIQDLERIMTAI